MLVPSIAREMALPLGYFPILLIRRKVASNPYVELGNLQVECETLIYTM